MNDHVLDTITRKLRGDDLTPRQRAERAELALLQDETYLRLRLSNLGPGGYVLWKPTPAVLRVAAEALERGQYDVYTDDPHIKIRRATDYTDTGDGVPLPLCKFGQGDFVREVNP